MLAKIGQELTGTAMTLILLVNQKKRGMQYHCIPPGQSFKKTLSYNGRFCPNVGKTAVVPAAPVAGISIKSSVARPVPSLSTPV